MNGQTSAPQGTETFDIETGMAVYDPDGKKIGTVMEIAGFGATRIPRAGDRTIAELVIQAKTGSGYFNLDRREVLGTRESTPLCVPFHGIRDVVPGHGVILNDTIIDELRHQRDPRPAKTMIPVGKRWRWWSRWM
ncbi:MAG TPA: hypothetical protein VKX16_17815 [Chloroflexota bacterium]|nr:hypothetical protein [Chloroflexota bacterium]